MTEKIITGLFYRGNELAELEESAREEGLSVFKFNCKSLYNKQLLLDQVSNKLNFPSYFGDNWDSLYECLTDLHWLEGPGIVFIFEYNEGLSYTNSKSFKTAIAVLESAADYWQPQAKIFAVWIQNP